jgi:hypothetical protein
VVVRQPVRMSVLMEMRKESEFFMLCFLWDRSGQRFL